MRAILLSLLLASTCSALGVEYNIDTGGVTIVDIEEQDILRLYIPTKHSLVDNVYDPDIDPGARDGLSRWSTGVTQPGSYLMNFAKWERPFGFDEEFFVGNIMLPGIDDGFEDKFFLQDGPYPYRWWSSVVDVVFENGMGYGRYSQFVIVPEPSSLWILSGLACFLGGWFLCGGRE